MVLALTLGILPPSRTEAQEAPWGWWDDGDSIARPVPDDAPFPGTRGGARLAIASGARGGPGTRRLDARTGAGNWKVDLAGRCDSSCVGIRQRLSWESPRWEVVAGDLPSWSGDPLLRDAGRVSARESPLSRLGSGRSTAGAEVRFGHADPPTWGAGGRVRAASVEGGGSRAVVEGSLGAVRAGMAFGDASGAMPTAMGGLLLRGPTTAVEASHLGIPGEGSWRLALRSEGEHLLQEWAIRRTGPSDSTNLPAREDASARISWKRDRSRLDWEGVARGDSPSGRELRTVAAVSRQAAGLVWRLRGRWRGGDGASKAALVPGIRRRTGRFRPWAECAWATGSDARPSAGAAWIDRGWRVEGSGTRRKEGAWDWSASSTLAREGSSLEMRLSERSSEIGGGGSWTFEW